MKMSAGQTSSQVLQDYLAVTPMNLSQLSSDEFDDVYSPTSSGGSFSNDNSSGSGQDVNESQYCLLSSQSSNSSSTLRLVNPQTLTDSQPQPIMDESVSSMKNEPEEQEVDLMEPVEMHQPSCSNNAYYFDSQFKIDSQRESQNFITTEDMQRFEGKYNFSCTIKELGPNQQFAEEREKLYCQPFTNINIQFNCDFGMIKEHSKQPLQLRCFLLFKDNHTIVTPCEKHQREMLDKIDASVDNEEFKKINHALHCIAVSSKNKPVYTTTDDGKPYLTVPLGKPTLGVQSVCKLFSFGCMNSCHNNVHNESRGIMVVFELLEGLELVGRSSFNVRVCACPTRDFEFAKSTNDTLEKVDKTNSTIKIIESSTSNKRDYQPSTKTIEDDDDGSQEGSQEVTKKKPRLEASCSTTNDISTNNCIEELSNLVLGESVSQEQTNKKFRVEELSCKAESILKMSESSIPLLNYLAYRLKNEIESVHHEIMSRSPRVLECKDNKRKTDDDSGTDQTLEEN